jgi:hypothetical protein
MKFSKYLEEVADLDMNDKGLFASPSDNLVGLYNVGLMKEGLKEYDTEIITKAVLGVFQYKEEQKAVEMYKVAAKQDYGPLTYLLAMQKAKELKKGLTPYSNPSQVSPEAKNVWRNFYDGKGSELVKTLNVGLKNHEEDYLNLVYTNVTPIKFGPYLKITDDILTDDKYGEKHDLFLEGFASYLQNAMRVAYPD